MFLRGGLPIPWPILTAVLYSNGIFVDEPASPLELRVAVVPSGRALHGTTAQRRRHSVTRKDVDVGRVPSAPSSSLRSSPSSSSTATASAEAGRRGRAARRGALSAGRSYTPAAVRRLGRFLRAAAIVVVVLAAGLVVAWKILFHEEPSRRTDVTGSLFTDVTAASGVAFRFHGDILDGKLIPTMGGGAALADFDGDGWLDLVLVQQVRHGPTWRKAGKTQPLADCTRLFRNRGDGTFEDVTERSGVVACGWGVTAMWADLDGDGFPDLVIGNAGDPNLVFRNKGDGTFERMDGDGPRRREVHDRPRGARRRRRRSSGRLRRELSRHGLAERVARARDVVHDARRVQGAGQPAPPEPRRLEVRGRDGRERRRRTRAARRSEPSRSTTTATGRPTSTSRTTSGATRSSTTRATASSATSPTRRERVTPRKAA